MGLLVSCWYPVHFDLLAPIYNFLIRRRYPKEILESCEWSSSGKLLEVGGGTGRFASYFIDRVMQVWLVDPSRAMIRQVQKRYNGRIKTKLGVAENLPFQSSIFDHVVISDSLHHWQEHQKGLQEVYRVIKPGGFLIIEEIHPCTRGGHLIRSMENWLKMGSIFFTPLTLIKMLRNLEFSIVKGDWTREPSYFILARK
ncbi:MAG: class I SAM-dependent methyltransferase [Candidatus Kariarchaeaceae archaeon]|jgi:demethylmenaquinone methyltransferase/2-methoxy-6-polyprenyl-1,4-benzoquinol methylase